MPLPLFFIVDAVGEKLNSIFVLCYIDVTSCCQDAVSLAITEEEPEAAARKLIDTAFTRGSADNITCIVVKFHHEKSEPVDHK